MRSSRACLFACISPRGRAHAGAHHGPNYGRGADLTSRSSLCSTSSAGCQQFYLRQNVDVSGSTAEGVAPEAGEVIQEFGALSLELYGHARDRSERLPAQQGCAFSQKVGAFQQLNTLYGKANRLRSLRAGRVAARRA